VLKELPKQCPSCRVIGNFYLSKLSVESNKWEKWKLLPDGVKVYGCHNYSREDETISRTYQHYIISKALMYSIHAHFGFPPDINIRRPSTVPDRMTAMSIWEAYYSMNHLKFECRHCLRKMLNVFKIFLKECKLGCQYFICRDCFLMRITDDPALPGKPKNRGFLMCPDCNKVGQAYYLFGNQRPVAMPTKKELI
jgi:hypothetical protein